MLKKCCSCSAVAPYHREQVDIWLEIVMLTSPSRIASIKDAYFDRYVQFFIRVYAGSNKGGGIYVCVWNWSVPVIKIKANAFKPAGTMKLADSLSTQNSINSNLKWPKLSTFYILPFLFRANSQWKTPCNSSKLRSNSWLFFQGFLCLLLDPSYHTWL